MNESTEYTTPDGMMEKRKRHHGTQEQEESKRMKSLVAYNSDIELSVVTAMKDKKKTEDIVWL